MTAVPELAESWESTPDAKQWVFRLRKCVEFHNGKTMDAKDVVYSINHCDVKTFRLLKRIKGIQGIETHGMMF